ncbi:hypothetical protein [Chryseobacterium luquanense]|uniref:Uncharacterized protein n=1 Tax=Chryseobacterium luquanense TaxID=2983766 RepID=A0ABT3Y4A6_9FLAO|nr:hypothetical protein [Chryseobacterium luquanense]MCX8532975.1 hypothetical protein [Chryseobacterium luquanense]
MKRFIFLSIFKTWLFSTFTSIIFLYLYMQSAKNPTDEYGNCDMGGLAYGLIIMWILFLSLISFFALLSLNKIFQNSILRLLCWFLFPFLFSVTFFLAVSEETFDKEIILISMISVVPWFSIWGFYYYQFNKKLFRNENV